MSIDATRIEKVEVQVSFPAVQGHRLSSGGTTTEVRHVLREKDARELMHALASALGYTCTPKSTA